MKKRLLSAAIAVLMLGSCVACTKNPPSGSDTTANETGSVTDPATTPDTAPGTDAETVLDWNTWEPVAGAGVTELSVLGTIPGSGVDPSQSREVTEVYEPGSTVYSLKEAEGNETTVTLKNNTVSAFRLSTAFNDASVATYQGKVQIKTDAADANWCSLFIGLRLSDVSKDPTSQSGIWIALQSREIGIRVGDWAATTLQPIKAEGVDFSTERTLYVEDDMTTDVVTLWADNDAGEKVEIGTVKLEDGKINFYHPGESKPAISDKILSSINGNGSVSLWLHHTKNPAVIRDFTATGQASPKLTVDDANGLAGRDILSDTWVCVDDEGRVAGVENGVVKDKEVGIFYFLWHDGSSSQPIYDHSLAYFTGGTDKLIETMKSGPLGFAHYWAEPYFGYYRSDDEWVIRKHTYQLVAAGVDFIFIDATNGITYENNYETILKVWSEMRAEGHETPQIMFHCGNTDSLAMSSLTALWNNLYSQGRYEDLWFRYDGKPLILMPQTVFRRLPDEMQDFFTCRQSWANTKDGWYTQRNGRGCWAWADMYPQKPGLSMQGDVEQMIVMCGFWVNGSYGTNAGRSYSYLNGGQPKPDDPMDFSFSLVDKTSGKGIAFEEQFDYAIEQNPGLIMITGWNEWWAGRWEAGGAIGQTIANSYVVRDDQSWQRNYFVDCFSPEHSRDIEPVKGLFNDNYYYQMVENIRQYKGSRVPLAAFGQRPIDVAGDLSQWDIVGPEFRDYTGDVTHRNHSSYVGQLTYTNKTGRNDFTVAKVSRYENTVTFYAACAAPITAAEGTNWMNLYIDADGKAETGWYGYDYLLNRSRDGETCSIQKFVGNAWQFEDVGTATMVVRDNTIQIAVDAKALGLGDTFDFKWADNSVDNGEIMEFLDLGDVAPDGRFNYRYTTAQAEIAIPEVMSADMTVLKAGSYYYYHKGELCRIDASTTKATFFGDNEHLYLALGAARAIFGDVFAGETTYNHYGVTYVDITAAVENSGRTVSRADGLLVLAGRAMTEREMDTIYRGMY